MELFKNSVGRPSNEVKKKRRNFIIAIILVCVMVIGGLSYLLMNKNLKKVEGKVYYIQNVQLSFKKYNGYLYAREAWADFGAGLILAKVKNDDVSIAFFQKGDVDFDGVITQNDARIILKNSASLKIYNELEKYNSDLNNDGKIKAGEARKVLIQSESPSSYYTYKVCISENKDISGNKCNWKQLSPNAFNTYKIKNNNKYNVIVKNVTKDIAYSHKVSFNGDDKINDTKSYVKFDKSSKEVKTNKTVSFTAETNDAKLVDIWVDNPELGYTKWEDKTEGTTSYHRVYTFHARKKSGVANVYLKSNTGAVNSIKIVIKGDYTKINLGNPTEIGVGIDSYNFTVETNDGKLKDIKWDGNIVNITRLNSQKIKNGNDVGEKVEYKLVPLTDGKTNITVKSTNGTSQTVQVITRADYPSADTVIGKNKYNVDNSTGVTIYSDKACNTKAVNEYIKVVKKLPKYAKIANRRVYLVRDDQYDKYTEIPGSAAVTYRSSTIPYIVQRCSYADDIVATTHEFGHAVDGLYGKLSGKKANELFKNDFKEWYSNGCYNAGDSINEFFAHAYTSYILIKDYNYNHSKLDKIGQGVLCKKNGKVKVNIHYTMYKKVMESLPKGMK